MSLTTVRHTMQAIACLGPATTLTCLTVLQGSLDRDQAELLFISALFCQSFSAAGFGCAAQDISTRYASLLYGATSVIAVIAGAAGQYYTGYLLEANGRDFSPLFSVTAVIEVFGFIAFLQWWRSDPIFD